MNPSIPIKIILATLVNEKIINQTTAQRVFNNLEIKLNGVVLDDMSLADFIKKLK